MFDYIRRAVEPTACQVFPINLFYFPLIYWFCVFLFFLFSNAGSMTLLNIAKISTIQMFKNAFSLNPFSMHPSSYVAATIILIVGTLEFICIFPMTEP